MARLFIALWPDAGVREALLAVQDACRPPRGRPVAAQDLHLTLAFLGETDAAGRDCATRAAAAAAAPLDLTLEVTGAFDRARVAWVGPAVVPPALAALHASLWRRLRERCGRAPETTPFRPHVTLWRNVTTPRAPARCAPVHWHADALYIVESAVDREGVRYHPVEVHPDPSGAD